MGLREERWGVLFGRSRCVCWLCGMGKGGVGGVCELWFLGMHAFSGAEDSTVGSSAFVLFASTKHVVIAICVRLNKAMMAFCMCLSPVEKWRLLGQDSQHIMAIFVRCQSDLEGLFLGTPAARLLTSRQGRHSVMYPDDEE